LAPIEDAAGQGPAPFLSKGGVEPLEPSADQKLSFDAFELLREQRQLISSGTPVNLGSRAFDLLLALVDRAGDVVSKDELMAAAWPKTFVDGTNLRTHIAAIRRALGDDGADRRFIVNVPGRGYSFVARVRRENAAPVELAPSHATSVPAHFSQPQHRTRSRLPRLVNRLVGRDEVVANLADVVTREALVTLVGPGGIGKTTTAIATAAAAAERFSDGAVFVDLTAVVRPQLVPGGVASAIGYVFRSADPTADLIEALRSSQLLIVLDNCEHVIGAAAALAEALGEAPHVHILATSREVLRAGGEWVYRLQPLDLPSEKQTLPAGAPIRAADALLAASVQLFVERASATLGGYELTDEDAPAIVAICRKLDGIALAIELAAGRMATVGFRDLDSSLGDSLQVLAHGRRTALPRHQTLRATLDWSYQLLAPSEQAVFRRLAVFHGNISTAAARAVAAGADLPTGEIDELLRGLGAKSLVVPELESQGVHYRLLATTRAFALEKLREAGEEADASRRHAAWMRALFEQVQEEWHTSPSAAWLSKYRNHLPNLRAALEWAFGSGEAAEDYVALAIAAVPLWFELSAVDECLTWVERALAIAEESPQPSPRQRMELYAALGWPSMRAVSGQPRGVQAWEKCRALAREIGDRDFQLRSLWAIWVAKTNAGRPGEALETADLFCREEIEAGEPPEHRFGSRLRARSLHLMGRQIEAKAEVEKMLASYVAPTSRSHIARFQYEQSLTARITLGRTLWVLGFPDRAMREMQAIVEEALSLGHILTLTHALSDGACPIALLTGDIDASERFTAMLDAYTRANALDVWHAYAECYHGQQQIARGDARNGVRRLNQALRQLEARGFFYHTVLLCALGEGFAQTGQFIEGLATIDEALSHCLQTGEAWCRPELLRVRGRLLAGNGELDDASACYRQSLDEAQAQDALCWMLRSATDLARLADARGDRAEARNLLAPIHARFTEGFTSGDFVAATRLLRELDPT
jgi:predicted ATPase/DNA-binding winged helix-turn-helix (wHTH) protein